MERTYFHQPLENLQINHFSASVFTEGVCGVLGGDGGCDNESNSLVLNILSANSPFSNIDFHYFQIFISAADSLLQILIHGTFLETIFCEQARFCTIFL